jgi:hypothetical protein
MRPKTASRKSTLILTHKSRSQARRSQGRQRRGAGLKTTSSSKPSPLRRQ